jgi:outer membrane protein OmpA-like peptidoglycan-associated protein
MKSFRVALAVSGFLFFLNACSTTPKTAPTATPTATPTTTPTATPKNLFVLMPDPDGRVGEIVVANKGGSQIVAKPRHATEVEDANVAPTAPFLLEESKIAEIFGAALAAQPDPPARYLLYFKTGSTDLTEESEKLLVEILETIEARRSTDISVVGHTDRVGSRQLNFRLGMDRADRIKKILVSKGVDSSIVEVDSHGEDSPLIKTEDEVPEPRNRRVEVTVR